MNTQDTSRLRSHRAALLAALLVALPIAASVAQPVSAPPVGSATATADNAMLLTVFLRHDQARPLAELNAQLRGPPTWAEVGG